MEQGMAKLMTSAAHAPAVVRSVRSLTGIRGIAALWVAAYHTMKIFALPRAGWTPLIEQGWSGVDLFFILSGFILMHSHGVEFRALEIASLRRFAWKRFNRVYPLNFVVTALVFVLIVCGAIRFNSDTVSNLFTATFATISLTTIWFSEHMTLNQPVWSLSAELVAYVAFPFICLGLTKLGRSAFLVAILTFVVMYAARVHLHQAHYNSFDIIGALIRVAGCFVLGVACRQVYSFLPIQLSRFAGPITMACTVSIGVFAISYNLSEFLPLIFGVLMTFLCCEKGLVSQALSSNLCMFLGRISFPLYLVHVTIMNWIGQSFVQNATSTSTKFLWATMSLISSVLLATLLHKTVEQPIHQFGRQKHRGRPQAEVADSISFKA